MWKEVVEAVGVLAIVASLVFVGLQIQQDQKIARAQLGSDTSNLVTEIYLALADPNLAAVYLKMLEQPEDLSPTEMVQLNGLLGSVSELFFRDCYLVDRGVFTECQTAFDFHGARFFGNKYAQSWWRNYRPPAQYGLVEELDTKILGLEQDLNRVILGKVKSDM